MNRIIAIPVLACGMIAAPIPLAGTASAYCDSPDCVPNVTRNVIAGGPCAPSRVFVYGLDAENKTYVCSTAAVWTAAGPLVGTRGHALPCSPMNASAQGPDGRPLICADINNALRWANRSDTPG